MCAEPSTVTYTISDLLAATDAPPAGAVTGSDVRRVVEDIIAAEGNPLDAVRSAGGRLDVLLDRTLLLCRYGQGPARAKKRHPCLLMPDAVDKKYVFTLGGDMYRHLVLSRELGFDLAPQFGYDEYDALGPDGLHIYKDLRKWVDRHREVYTFLPHRFEWVLPVKIAPEDRRVTTWEAIKARLAEKRAEPPKKRARVAH